MGMATAFPLADGQARYSADAWGDRQTDAPAGKPIRHDHSVACPYCDQPLPGDHVGIRSAFRTGWHRGWAAVRLMSDGDATVLQYNVSATVGGKLAQLGGRLLDNTARSLASDFFENFRQVVCGEAPGESSDTEEAAS